MGLKLHLNFDRIEPQNYKQQYEETYRGVNKSTTEHFFGPCKTNPKTWLHEPYGTEGQNKLGTVTELTTETGLKQVCTLDDGAQVLAKNVGDGTPVYPKEYSKVLYRASKESPWELLAYKNSEISYTNINRLREIKLPNFVDLTSSNSKFRFDWSKLSLGSGFDGLNSKMPGLTKCQLSQLKQGVLNMLRLI